MKIGFRIFFLGLFLAWTGRAGDLKARGNKTVIKEHIHTYLTTRYAQPSLRFKVNLKWLPPSIKDRSSIEVTSVEYTGRNKIPHGYEIFQIGVKDETGLSGTERVQVFVLMQRRLPVATRRIPRGAALTVEAVHPAWIDVTRSNRNWITSVKAAEGQVTKMIINAGDPIAWSDVRATPVIFPGDTIELWYNPGGFRVQLSCVARQSGAIGEEIRLYSRETGRVYIGTIINKSTVKWKSTL